jgi:hypothetical protein
MTEKIFIGTPTYIGKYYCFEAWNEAMQNIDYPSELLTRFFADNSPLGNYEEKLLQYGSCTWINPEGKTNIQVLAESHNALRDAFLKSDAEYFFHVESDVFLRPDTLQSLLKHQQEVVSALYYIGQGKKSKMMFQKLIHLSPTDLKAVNIGLLQSFLALNGTLKRSYHFGLGCVLIHRGVMERVQFRYVPGVNVHPDTWFADDCFALGIPVYADTSQILSHQNQDWSANYNYYTY